MEGISDIYIVGIDDKRPPFIRKEPYIDIVFKLSHAAPVEWCNIFNTMLAKHASKPKIKDKEGLYIEAWIKTPDEIVALLNDLKAGVAECSRVYIERIERITREANAAQNALSQGGGEQARLNRIIAALDFGAPEK